MKTYLNFMLALLLLMQITNAGENSPIHGNSSIILNSIEDYAIVAPLLFNSKDESIINEIRALAESGNIHAQYFLGSIYQDGRRLERDLDKSLFWYSRSGEGGNPLAFISIADIYMHGWSSAGIDLSRALNAYEKGYSEAKIADPLYIGKNGENIFEMMQTSIARNIAEIYDNNNNSSILSEIYLRQHLGATKSDTEQWINDKAIEWLMIAADLGDADSMNDLGVRYDLGQGVKIDYEKAVELYTQAASAGQVYAQSNLAKKYWRGEGVEKDLEKAEQWFSKAVENGYDSAKKNLASVRQEIALEKKKQAGILVITADQLVAMYENNEIKADKNLAGKTLEITGIATGIKKGVMGELYVTLAPVRMHSFREIQCFFSKEASDQLADLDSGDVVTIKGVCKGLMANVLIEDCTLVTE